MTVLRTLRKYLTKLVPPLPAIMDKAVKDQEWRSSVLETQTSDFLFRSEPSVKLLQSSIANIDPQTQTFQAALGKMLNNFPAPPDTPGDALSCLRAVLQILVTYSISSGDVSWLDHPDTRAVEQAGSQLAILISSFTAIPKPTSRHEPDTVDKCRYHALLHKKKAQMELHRDLIIRAVSNIAGTLPLWKPFHHYDPKNNSHTSQAIDILYILSSDFRLVGQALCLTLNPVPSYCHEEKDDEKTLVDETEALLG
ncbi:MAG: hypothetical protein LQ343_000981 [Gyalolechia ehrenbergii]|nr:MAG: hypothetical protein LQ343_000981 [Gyalolechia ehrenbergii]